MMRAALLLLAASLALAACGGKAAGAVPRPCQAPLPAMAKSAMAAHRGGEASAMTEKTPPGAKSRCARRKGQTFPACAKRAHRLF